MIYKLKDICIRITDGSHFSPKAKTNGYPMFSVKDMLTYGFDYSNCKRICKEDFEKMLKSGCVPQAGDVLVAKDGSYLKEIFVCTETKKEAVLSSIAIFRPNQKIVNSYFLCYLLKSPNIYNYISSNCVSGSALPRIILKAFKEIEVDIPDLHVQENIVRILKLLDDKIALNTRINRNLYEQAVALFEAMYQGYPVKKIGELDIFVTDYVANGSFASLKENVTILEEKNYAYFVRNVDLKAKEFPRFVNQHSYEFLSKSKLVGGEVIISNVGDVGSVFLCPKLDGPMTLGNNMIMLTSPKHNNYLYLFFKSYIGQGKIGGITGGSAQPKFNKTDFKSLEINYPDESQVDEFNEKTSALLDMISKLDEENKQLTALRDSLLPKLMSGELDVSDLDI